MELSTSFCFRWRIYRNLKHDTHFQIPSIFDMRDGWGNTQMTSKGLVLVRLMFKMPREGYCLSEVSILNIMGCLWARGGSSRIGELLLISPEWDQNHREGGYALPVSPYLLLLYHYLLASIAVARTAFFLSGRLTNHSALSGHPKCFHSLNFPFTGEIISTKNNLFPLRGYPRKENSLI